MTYRYLLLALLLCLSSTAHVKASNNNYLKSLDISKEIPLDVVSNILLGEGFSVTYDNPRFYNITFEKENVTIDLEYTPTSKIVYSYIIIADTINKTDLLDGPRQVLELLTSKYGTPNFAGEPHETHVNYGVSEYVLENVISGDSLLLDTCSLRRFVKGVYSPENFEYVWNNDSFNISFRCTIVYRDHLKEFFLYNINNVNIKEKYFSERKEIEDHEKHMDFLQKAFYVFLGLVAIVIIIVVLYKKNKKEQEKIAIELKEIEKKQAFVNEQYNQFVRELRNKYGVIDRVISIMDYDNDLIELHNDIFVFQDSKVVIINKTKYDFSDIISCSILDENQRNTPVSQVTKTKTGNMLGRAAVGALTFGVAGAVVGAVTAEKESTTNEPPIYMGSYIVKVGVKSIKEPMLVLKFSSDKSKAEEVYALIQAIIAMK